MKRILVYGLLLVALGMQAQELLPWPTDTIDGKVYYSASVSGSTTVSVPSGQLYIVTAPGKYPRRLVP